MRRSEWLRPRWALSVLTGVPFGVAMGVNGLIVFVAGAVIGVVDALAGSPLFWLVAVGGVGTVVAEVVLPMRLRRRVEVLAA